MVAIAFGTDEQTGIGLTLDVGHHNVSDLLESLLPEQRADYGHKYDQRAPEQVASRNGLIMTWEQPAAATLRHMRYRAELSRQNIHVVSPKGTFNLDGQQVDLDRLIGGQKLRVVPYFPSHAVDGLVEQCIPQHLPAHLRRFGLPSQIAELVKDKQKFHEFMKEFFPTLIPRFDVLSGAELIDDRIQSPIEIVMLQTSELIAEAQAFGLNMEGYRNGVVLRKILSDGGFGTLIVRQKLDHTGYEVIGDKTLEAPTIHELMAQVITPSSQYLMTRLLELDASPGISCMVRDGELFVLPLNSQIQDESGAAIGTKTLGLFSHDLHDIEFRHQHEELIQAFAIQIFDRVLDMCPDRSGVEAMINLDFMVTSEREQKLYTLVRNSPSLFKHMWHLISQRYQVAEMNPRMTNLTSAANGVLTIMGAEHDIYGYRRLLAAEGDLGLVNYDSKVIAMPDGMSIDDIYCHFLDRNHKLRAAGYQEAGIILRMMPRMVDDKPAWAKGAGITIYGPKACFGEVEMLALG
jgi:hypothetical protein